MTLAIRNLAWLRSLKIDGVPEFGARMKELVDDIVAGSNTLEQQGNFNLNGIPAPPPRLQSMTVTPTAVGHHISINDGEEFYRGKFYHVESADNANFANPFPAYSGPAREIDLATGNQKLYFQAFSSYLNSDNSSVVFHGGSTPQPVIGGTATPRGVSQGGGTSRPGEGRAGFGATPYRGSKPPQRGTA
jgi:hypothetical protein